MLGRNTCLKCKNKKRIKNMVRTLIHDHVVYVCHDCIAEHNNKNNGLTKGDYTKENNMYNNNWQEKQEEFRVAGLPYYSVETTKMFVNTRIHRAYGLFASAYFLLYWFLVQPRIHSYIGGRVRTEGLAHSITTDGFTNLVALYMALWCLCCGVLTTTIIRRAIKRHNTGLYFRSLAN